ncbi:MAG: class A beta-lactamase [Chthoniobacterales bacterium]
MVALRWAITLLALLAVADAQAISAPEAGARVAQLEHKAGGRLGVAALETGTGQRIEHRPNERFPMCSTFKFLLAAAMLERAEQKKEQLDRFVPYTAGDILEYAPVTKKHLSKGGMTVAALGQAALQWSDNTAANLLLATLNGPPGLTSYVRSLGDETTRLDRNEPTLNTALPGDERDTTTPVAMLEDMRRLLLGEALSAPSREQLETWLRGNTTGAGKIRAGVPGDWVVGDKTGSGANGATNDIAILRPPGGAPILLAVYFVGSKAPPEKRAAVIADVAKIVADFQQRN